MSMEKDPLDREASEPQPIEKEISKTELIDVFKEFLLWEDIDFLNDPEVDSFEAINYLYGVLPERGVHDPEAKLIERRLLEPRRYGD